MSKNLEKCKVRIGKMCKVGERRKTEYGDCKDSEGLEGPTRSKERGDGVSIVSLSQ